jgi:hypothetical protein
MPDAARPESAHRRPHTPPMASPFLEFETSRMKSISFAVSRRRTRVGISASMQPGARSISAPASLVAHDHGSAHDIEALEDSAFLLTSAWPARSATQIGNV